MKRGRRVLAMVATIALVILGLWLGIAAAILFFFAEGPMSVRGISV